MAMKTALHISILLLNLALSIGYTNSFHHARSVTAETGKDLYEVRSALTDAIARGAEIAREQCKDQFKWERWDCPDSAFSRKETLPVTKEMGFVSSVTSAGIVYSVARSCAKGELKGCGCGEESDPDWKWSGCSDNILVGERVSDLFLGALEHGSTDLNSEANLHNYRLGKSVVRENVRKECKCHGLSGSCTTQTCWRRVGAFREVAETLKKRYERALRIDWNHATKPSPADIPETSMVFLADSPDYCKANITTGWKGTAGRICSRAKGGSRSEKRSCRELCRACGHQVKKRTIEKTKLCNCTFQWCCKVACSKCTHTVQEFYCDATPMTYLKG